MPTRSQSRILGKPPVGTSTRSKRDLILTAAARQFGRQGYEDTKWADIAAEVGVGSTALYHYFESKLHCLFEIMSEALVAYRAVFDEVTRGQESFESGFNTLVHANFELSDSEVARCRVLVAEQGRLSQPRSTAREEEARQRARSLTRDLEVAWSNYLSRGMAIGAIPEANPQLLTRAVLGFYNSIWHWYRPQGTLSLADIDAFFAPGMLTLVGLNEPISRAEGLRSVGR